MKTPSQLGMVPLWFASDATVARRERKFFRFVLECPVSLKYQVDSPVIEVQAIIQNVSIGGFLLTSAAMIPQPTTVTFVICLRGEVAGRPIYLKGNGEIVRVEQNKDDASFAIAVECTGSHHSIGDIFSANVGLVLARAVPHACQAPRCDRQLCRFSKNLGKRSCVRQHWGYLSGCGINQ